MLRIQFLIPIFYFPFPNRYPPRLMRPSSFHPCWIIGLIVAASLAGCAAPDPGEAPVEAAASGLEFVISFDAGGADRSVSEKKMGYRNWELGHAAHPIPDSHFLLSIS